MTLNFLFLALGILMFIALCTFYCEMMVIEKKLIAMDERLRSISAKLKQFEGRIW